jgi:hypothetical protein
LREAQADRLGEKFAFLLPLGFIQAPCYARVFSPTFSSDVFQLVLADAVQQLREFTQRGGGRPTGPIIVCCQPALAQDFLHGPFVAIRPLMFHQAGFAGPTNRAVAEGCLDMVTATGLPADPASETPLVRCWWRYLDP